MKIESSIMIGADSNRLARKLAYTMVQICLIQLQWTITHSSWIRIDIDIDRLRHTPVNTDKDPEEVSTR